MSTLDALPGVTHLRSRARLADVLLPAPQRRRLEELVQAARGRRTAALFTGPPGTGKTFAALALANELGRPLFKVDLALFASRYIGETEKNLAAVFDRAEELGVVLEFDEADALFGERTDVQDAHDRYANTAVSYLLDRLERGAGLAVLTTRWAERLDRRVLDRIDCHVEFPLPDRELRVALWRRHLPECVATDVSVERLADELEVCGRAIRNAGRRAREIAEDLGRPVGLREVGEALREVLDEDEERPAAAAAQLAPLRDLLRGGL